MLSLFNISHFQFHSLLCCNGETNSTRIRRRTSHSKIETYDESYCQDAIVRVVFNFSEPGEETLRKSRSMEINWSRKVDRGDPIKAQIYLKPPINSAMSNSWKASLQQVIQNWATTVFGLLQEWKTETTTYDRSGRPDKTSWRMVRKIRPDHEEILLDGIAQSVRNGETLRDRSGRPDNMNSQEVARPQNFIMGNDETELELSVKSRSFVNRVNDQVRKRQKNFQCCRRWRRTFYDLVNVYGCNNGISDIMRKNFQNNRNSIANTTDLTFKPMFDISAKLVTEQGEISGLETIGWEKHS